MQDMIARLKTMEELAANVYKEAAEAFKDDADLHAFLTLLSEQEAQHREFMADLGERMATLDTRPGEAVIMTEETQDRLEAPLRAARERIATGDLSKKELIEDLVAAESSEWNDIFVYVVNTAQKDLKSAQHMAAEIEAHKERIREFTESLPDELKPERNLDELPVIWERRILVVDDDEALRMLLEGVLATQAVVETAENGKVGLAKASEKFFDLILSDIDMPGMDGFEFYLRLIEIDPTMAPHFLFWSGAITPEREAFVEKHGLRCLAKPIELDKLGQEIAEMIRAAHKGT